MYAVIIERRNITERREYLFGKIAEYHFNRAIAENRGNSEIEIIALSHGFSCSYWENPDFIR